MSNTYWKNWKISGPNGSTKCPESIEMGFGPFREKYFRRFFDDFWDQHFSKQWTSEGSAEGVTQINKGSYIDPLVMRFSPKILVF